MAKKTKRVSKIGMSPGALVYTGEKKVEQVSLSIIDYSETQYSINETPTIEEILAYKDTTSISWINIDGLHDVSILDQISKHFEIHPLVVEDILSPHQRPKIEFFEDYMYIVLVMLRNSADRKEIISEQVSIICRKNVVITFQEIPGDVFNPIRDRIRTGSVRIRKLGTDYLTYALLDVIVDNYFLALEQIGDELEVLEAKVLEENDDNVVQKLFNIKRQLIEFRRSVWPLREVVSAMQRQEIHLIKKATTRFISDLYDHVVQIIDTLETYRETTVSILDIHLTIISNRMNEVMKVLTIIATIFIPLSFIAGVYGMNFDTTFPMNLPELGYRYGYLFFWGLVVVVSIGLLYVFRRKKWL